VNNAQANVLTLILGTVFCCGTFLFIGGGIGALIYFLSRRNRAAQASEFSDLLEEWAERNGYQVLRIGQRAKGGHPFADRFGFGVGKKPATVFEVEMRDRRGHRRLGWAYVRIRLQAGPRGPAFGGYIRDSLEVAWDEG
jgi:hypothetical protein